VITSRRRIVVASKVARPARRSYVCKPYPIPPPVDDRKNYGVKKGPWWDWYNKYLRSEYWKARRRAALQRAGHKCQRCGTRRYTLQVHHLKYVRVGREEMEDLEVCCVRCHDNVHSISCVSGDAGWEEIDETYADEYASEDEED